MRPMTTRAAVLSLAAAAAAVAAVQGQPPPVHRLEPSTKTVVFGAFDPAIPPALRIHSGDVVELHTFIANGYPRLLAAGLAASRLEPGLRELDDALRPAQAGPHFLSGPIYIEE